MAHRPQAKFCGFRAGRRQKRSPWARFRRATTCANRNGQKKDSREKAPPRERVGAGDGDGDGARRRFSLRHDENSKESGEEALAPYLSAFLSPRRPDPLLCEATREASKLRSRAGAKRRFGRRRRHDFAASLDVDAFCGRPDKPTTQRRARRLRPPNRARRQKAHKRNDKS